MNQLTNIKQPVVLLAIITALGISLGGFFIGNGLIVSRANRPYLTVKGLAERSAKSDLAVWTISYTVIGNDITTTNNDILNQQSLVLNFVKNQGFPDKDVSLDQIKFVDRYANDYSANKPDQRYSIKGTVRIRSHDVDRVQMAAQKTGELVKDGILISGDNDDNLANPAYFFTELNAIRPAMLSEATTSALNIAGQFAKDAKSKLGSIRRANQGIFEITSLDTPGFMDGNNAWQVSKAEQGSVYKKIRLVSTVDYYLRK